MPRRTMAQVALLLMGLIIWGYGVRAGDERLTLIAIGFFAVAFVLRFFRKKPREEEQ